MIFRNLDQDGDWEFGSGVANYATQDKAIGLNIRTRILSWVGDCFFDINAGIDWVNRLGFKNQRPLLEQELKVIILQSFGVTGLLKFDTTLIDRNFQATYDITTIYSKSYQDSIGVNV
jgi:hypothetical protein